MKITGDDVVRGLSGLPGEECHYAKLTVTTLHNTMSIYEENMKRTK